MLPCYFLILSGQGGARTNELNRQLELELAEGKVTEQMETHISPFDQKGVHR